jgi:hypothetical protein
MRSCEERSSLRVLGRAFNEAGIMSQNRRHPLWGYPLWRPLQEPRQDSSDRSGDAHREQDDPLQAPRENLCGPVGSVSRRRRASVSETSRSLGTAAQSSHALLCHSRGGHSASRRPVMPHAATITGSCTFHLQSTSRLAKAMIAVGTSTTA